MKKLREPILIKLKEGKNALADAIKNEVFRERRNYAVIVTGLTQTRKSTIALGLAYAIDPEFQMETQLGMIQSETCLKVLNQALDRGSVILLDEFEVGAYHRQWYSFLNRALNFIMATHGHKGCVVIVTTPHFDYIDSDTQKLFDMIIKVVKKSDNTKSVIAEVKTQEWNQEQKQFYYQKPRVQYPNKTIEVADFLRLHYASQDVLDRYFTIANSSKIQLANELRAHNTKIKADELKRGVFSPDGYVEKIVKEPEKFIKEYRGRKYVSVDYILNSFRGIGGRRANQIKAEAERQLIDKLAM